MAMAAGRRAQQTHRVGDDGRERDGQPLRGLLATEGQNLTNEIGSTPRGGVHGIEARYDSMTRLDVEPRELEVAEHGRQQVVEVVRDAPCERADRLHLLRLT